MSLQRASFSIFRTVKVNTFCDNFKRFSCAYQSNSSLALQKSALLLNLNLISPSQWPGLRHFSDDVSFDEVVGKSSFFKAVDQYVKHYSDSSSPEIFSKLYTIGSDKGFDEETIEIAVMKACREDNNYTIAKRFSHFIKERQGNLPASVLFQFLAICGNMPEVK